MEARETRGYSYPMTSAFLGAAVIKDVYLSFKFSQGNAALQDTLLDLVAQGTDPGLDLESLKSSAVTRALIKLGPPKAHERIGKSRAIPEFVRRFHELVNKINSHRGKVEKGEQPTSSRETLLYLVLKGIEGRDLNYMYKERPVGNDLRRDTHASFLREYAVVGTPTTSPIYDRLFHEIGDIVTNLWATSQEEPANFQLTYDLRLLKERWESHHKGDSFFPKELVASP